MHKENLNACICAPPVCTRKGCLKEKDAERKTMLEGMPPFGYCLPGPEITPTQLCTRLPASLPGRQIRNVYGEFAVLTLDACASQACCRCMHPGLQLVHACAVHTHLEILLEKHMIPELQRMSCSTRSRYCCLACRGPHQKTTHAHCCSGQMRTACWWGCQPNAKNAGGWSSTVSSQYRNNLNIMQGYACLERIAVRANHLT